MFYSCANKTNEELTLKIKFIAIFILYCSSQLTFALDVFKTGVPLSSSLGDMYCQNIVHNEKSDWRMPALPDLLELLSKGIEFETTYCSNSTRTSSVFTYHQCITLRGELIEMSASRAEKLMCIRGTSEFSALPALEDCPTASFSMSEGILHIPLVNVPNLLGDIEKYDVHLKLVSDDLLFEFFRATKLE